MIIKNKKELEILREGGRRLAAILAEVAEAAKEGVKTKALDELAEKLILKAGGEPSFKGYKPRGAKTPYPASLCVSINEEVVHGIPSERKLKIGDIVGLDIGMWHKGLCTDTAITLLIDGGEADASPRMAGLGFAPKEQSSDSWINGFAARPSASKLIKITKKSLDIGIAEVRAGACVGDVSYAIQQFLEKEGLGVVRELVGHGVGQAVHEEPEIPNWGKKGTGPELLEGMVIALEPMATEGGYKVKLAPDGWTWVTKDGSRAAHFEHTVVVTKTGAEVLTRG